MNKKLIISFLVIVFVGISLFCIFNYSENNKRNKENTGANDNTEVKKPLDEEEYKMIGNSGVVVYFSATGTTKKIANYISEITNSKMIEIVPKVEYTDKDLNYNNDDSRANREQSDNDARPEIKNDINIADYDIVYLGYPIWWGDVPKIILTFIESHKLEGKRIIPFCTSHSSGMDKSLRTLKSYGKLDIIDGRRFGSSTTKEEIESWLKDVDGRY